MSMFVVGQYIFFFPFASLLKLEGSASKQVLRQCIYEDSCKLSTDQFFYQNGFVAKIFSDLGRKDAPDPTQQWIS